MQPRGCAGAGCSQPSLEMSLAARVGTILGSGPATSVPRISSEGATVNTDPMPRRQGKHWGHSAGAEGAAQRGRGGARSLVLKRVRRGFRETCGPADRGLEKSFNLGRPQCFSFLKMRVVLVCTPQRCWRRK